MPSFPERKVLRYLNIAKNFSEQSDFPTHKLGCIAIYKNSLLAHGFNTVKTSPVQKKYNKARHYNTNASFANTNCTHAEISCLTKMRYLDIDFSRVTLFVYREHKNGSPALAKPCPACRKFIMDMGIKDVYYTDDFGWSHQHFN